MKITIKQEHVTIKKQDIYDYNYLKIMQIAKTYHKIYGNFYLCGGFTVLLNII